MGTQWFVERCCFRNLGNCPNIIPHCIWAYSPPWIWYSGACCTYFGTFQLWLSGVDKFTHCQMLNKLEKEKVIRPYVPLFGSSLASTLLRVLSRRNSIKRNSGLYKVGHGEKSVIWYWEFDREKQYFHKFRTIDYAAAVDFYTANKFSMWEEED